MAQNNWAVVIGINQYEHLPERDYLKYAVSDAIKMQEFLCNQAQFPLNNVLLCCDSYSENTSLRKRPSRSVLRDILLNKIKQARGADNFWFFFAGHGLVHEHKDFLLPCDGNPDDLRETAIPISFITDCLRDCEAQNVVLILDMCRNRIADYGSRGVGELIGEETSEIAKEQGIVTLFSCGRGQRSYEIADLKQGAFTYALLEVLKKNTTVRQLEDYLIHEVPSLNQRHEKPVQVPVVILEPAWKYDYPLLRGCAAANDIRILADQASNAEREENYNLADSIWRQVLEASNSTINEWGIATRAIQRIEEKSKKKKIPTIDFSTTHNRFDENWKAPLSILLGLGVAAGSDFVEFFLERSNYISCLAEDDQITSISPRLSTGAGVRVFKGKADCYVSTNDISFNGLKSALEKALGIMALHLPTPNSYVPEINLELLRDYATKKGKDRWLSECSSMRDMGGVLLAANGKLKQTATHIQARRAAYFRDWQEVLIAASDGTFARDIRLTQSVGYNLLCAYGANQSSIGLRVGDTSNPGFLTSWDYGATAEDVSESAGKMLYADYVESGTYPIIMANQFGGAMFQACGHLLETTQIEKNTTPFIDMKGQKIAHESLTAWDEGLSDNCFGTIDMDDEGMPAQRTLLIENGVLRNFLSDRAGQIRTGHPRTGSGRRNSYAYAAASRMRNTYIAPGNFTTSDLFNSIDKGIYCKQMGGGSIGAEGQFNFDVGEAYLIENGQVTKPLKGLVLVGEAQGFLNKISMSSQDLGLGVGFNSSVSGSVYVGIAQPHIKVDSITVGRW
jgi:TldD protein